MPAAHRLGDGEAARSTPSMRIVPAVGAATPPRMRISVLLPAPFSPISADDLARGERKADVVERPTPG